MTNSREIEPADVTMLYEAFSHQAVEMFNEHKEHPPQLVAIELGADTAKIKKMLFVDPSLVNHFHATAGRTDMLMAFVRFLLTERIRPRECSADGRLTRTLKLPENFAPQVVVHISEGWVVKKKGLKTEPKPVLPLDGYESIEDHPDRSEALFISIHTSERSYSGMCPVAGVGAERRASFGPMSQGFTGRMSLNREDGHDLH